ncbi:hypothetical protein [Streptomyces sp. NPDC003863]
MRMQRMLLPGLLPVSVREACPVVDETRSRYPYIGRPGEDGLYVTVGGNGHGARGRDETGRLASTVVRDQEEDFPLPPETFAPTVESLARPDRPCHLKPPFGPCRALGENARDRWRRDDPVGPAWALAEFRDAVQRTGTEREGQATPSCHHQDCDP